MTIPEIAALLREHDNYIMLTHRRPDGDTIGSSAALCRGLRAMGKTAYLLKNPQFTEKFQPYLADIVTDTVPENAFIISVDVATESMLQYNSEKCVNPIPLVIDHHERSGVQAPNRYVDPDAAATGEIILAILQAMKAPIEAKTAEAIYVAVSTDTGCFRFSNVTANTLRTAAACIDCGADTFAVNQVMFLTRRMARLQLEAYLTQTTEFYANGTVAVSAMPTQLRQELGLTEDDIDDISGFGREIEGVEIAVMLREVDEGGKVSIRTSPKFNASEICSKIGGGGHAAAAGATVKGSMDDAKQAALRAIAEIGVRL